MLTIRTTWSTAPAASPSRRASPCPANASSSSPACRSAPQARPTWCASPWSARRPREAEPPARARPTDRSPDQCTWRNWPCERAAELVCIGVYMIKCRGAPCAPRRRTEDSPPEEQPRSAPPFHQSGARDGAQPEKGIAARYGQKHREAVRIEVQAVKTMATNTYIALIHKETDSDYG